MRELKYRVWGVDINGEGERKMWFVPDIRDTDTSRRVFSELEDNDVMELNPWMQYTGLKDKNSVEIYEGDIVKEWPDSDAYWVRIVEYTSHGFALSTMANFLQHKVDWTKQVEVIGNIYEHPDLLEATK